MTLLQDGQRCIMSWQDSIQNGIKQHRKHLGGGNKSFRFAKLCFFVCLLCFCSCLFGFYPKNPSAAHTSQVIRPAVGSVLVITVCWQWGHKVCPGTSWSAGDTTTCVTEEKHTKETLKCPQSHIRKQFARCALLRMETILKRALFYALLLLFFISPACTQRPH